MTASSQAASTAVPAKLPTVAVVFAVVSLLNEISAQMVAPLIPIFLATILAAGPVALGAVEAVADAMASLLRLWSGRHADGAPHRRKWLALIGYAISNLSRPVIPRVIVILLTGIVGLLCAAALWLRFAEMPIEMR